MKFIEKFGLTFPMIADKDKAVIDAYGAREVLGVTAKRRTFLIGPDGVVAFVWPAVKVEGHTDEVVAKIRELAAA
jgi:peroxiredoxin Q/BCP